MLNSARVKVFSARAATTRANARAGFAVTEAPTRSPRLAGAVDRSWVKAAVGVFTTLNVNPDYDAAEASVLCRSIQGKPVAAPERHALREHFAWVNKAILGVSSLRHEACAVTSSMVGFRPVRAAWAASKSKAIAMGSVCRCFKRMSLAAKRLPAHPACAAVFQIRPPVQHVQV